MADTNQERSTGAANSTAVDRTPSLEELGDALRKANRVVEAVRAVRRDLDSALAELTSSIAIFTRVLAKATAAERPPPPKEPLPPAGGPDIALGDTVYRLLLTDAAMPVLKLALDHEGGVSPEFIKKSLRRPPNSATTFWVTGLAALRSLGLVISAERACWVATPLAREAYERAVEFREAVGRKLLRSVFDTRGTLSESVLRTLGEWTGDPPAITEILRSLFD